MKIAVKSEMFRVKWEPSLREKFNNEKQLLGFASGYIYGLSECGQFCPLCMTDGVARLIDLFCDDEDKARLLPHIFTDNADELYSGAMFLTEKTGGSDVGANLVVATHKEGKNYFLNGEKWFCSNDFPNRNCVNPHSVLFLVSDLNDAVVISASLFPIRSLLAFSSTPNHPRHPNGAK